MPRSMPLPPMKPMREDIDIIDIVRMKDGPLLARSSDLRISNLPFELRCNSGEWLPEYAAHHARKLKDGVGFFHLHEWLTERGIESQHCVTWAGWKNVRLWLLAHLCMVLFPHCKKRGMTRGFWD